MRQQILFFSWIWYLSQKVAPVFFSESFDNTSYVRSSHWSCSVKDGVLKYFANFTGKHLCWTFFESSGLQIYQKVPLTLVFSCGICESFKNIYFEKNLWILVSFAKICKNSLFAEHHQTTASYYSNINSSKGRIGEWICKLRYKHM